MTRLSIAIYGLTLIGLASGDIGSTMRFGRYLSDEYYASDVENGDEALPLIATGTTVTSDDFKTFLASQPGNSLSERFSELGNDCYENLLIYSNAMKDASVRSDLANTIANLTSSKEYHGCDIGWKLIAEKNGSEENAENGILFFKELGGIFRGRNLTLSVTLPGPENSFSRLTSTMSTVSKYLKFVNVLLPDLRGSWNSTSELQPLRPNSGDSTAIQRSTKAKNSLKYWKDQGIPRIQLKFSIPFDNVDENLNYEQGNEIVVFGGPSENVESRTG